jgi:hypothetical protein
MRKILLLIVLMLGCTDIFRDKNIYKSELSFIRELNKQEVASLKAFIKDNCSCDNLSVQCNKALKTLIVADTRMGWHLDMMAHNGGVGPAAGEPPVIPDSILYCRGL